MYRLTSGHHPPKFMQVLVPKQSINLPTSHLNLLVIGFVYMPLLV